MDRYSYREGGDGIEGIGYGKKRMLPCNVDDRVYTYPDKGADFQNRS